MSKKTIILFITALLLGACGKKNNASFTDVGGDQTCTIVDNIMTCPDGTEYVLPTPEDVTPVVVVEPDLDITVVVETEPSSPEEPDALCERNNRHKRKCRKIKKRYDEDDDSSDD